MPSGNPKLSVLIPVYNAEKYVADAIKSILLQTYQDFEVLVCNDVSTDHSWEVLNSISHNKLRIFKNEKNLGKNKTVEYLLTQATGKYITVHDADDISLPDRFERQMNFLLTHPDFVLCGTNFISFLDSGKIIDHSRLETDSKQIRHKIKTESQFHGPTIIFKKSILPEVGGLYRFFTRAEDIDFTMRVAQKFDTTNMPEHLYLYRHVETSLTNNLDGYNIERLGHAKLLRYLHEEREQGGVDSLMKGDQDKIQSLMKDFTAEYRQDPTIALRRGVFRLLGMHMFGNALKLSFISLRKDVNVLNFKCVIYTLFACVGGMWKLLNIREKVDLSFLNDSPVKKTV